MTTANAARLSDQVSLEIQRQLVAQQAFRRHDDEWARVGTQQRCLAPQQQEVLRRGCAVGDPEVLLGGKLKEPLEPPAGVIRALALPGVRQQDHQA